MNVFRDVRVMLLSKDGQVTGKKGRTKERFSIDPVVGVIWDVHLDEHCVLMQYTTKNGGVRPVGLKVSDRCIIPDANLMLMTDYVKIHPEHEDPVNILFIDSETEELLATINFSLPDIEQYTPADKDFISLG